MTISVVIPTTGQSQILRRVVESVLGSIQIWSSQAEVIVVVNGDGASSALTALGSESLRVIEIKQRSAAGARNAGISAAQHDAILFTDDDCIVPKSWCSDLGSALHKSDHDAVAAPVYTPSIGPITSFLNYQRILDAPPINATEVRYFITANCGFRRDRISKSIRFDDVNFNNAAEDADFGYRLRDNGTTIRWLPNSAPVRHVLTESISEITERFARYGRGNARLYHRCGRWLESVPGVYDWYRDLMLDNYGEFRRFSEFEEEAVRIHYSAYELILIASFMIGYLLEMGSELGYPLITIDHEKLTHSWDELDRQLKETRGQHFAIASNGKSLKYDRLCRPVEDTLYINSTIASILQRYAYVSCDVLPDTIIDTLNANASAFARFQDSANHRLAKIWMRFKKDGGDSTQCNLEHVMREIGVTFMDGCHNIEKLAYTKLPNN